MKETYFKQKWANLNLFFLQKSSVACNGLFYVSFTFFEKYVRMTPLYTTTIFTLFVTSFQLLQAEMAYC